ncbi:sugar ABC transporter substrate-binding protein [Quadrisphaera sp. INWT6]|uniref:ABC transporter substrate-binding protein n=1 Tax=Quadrisphaera sp. INWT6 TaxID=2596917 RepID=UPI001891F797|nr:sugar ABC transporter substrate-binding protein [Quadrisphaera sp. INWT6]MBF5080892.1 sugar ABC transporter substrate-binding protein [Quadrisphaera sp. INWT6]
MRTSARWTAVAAAALLTATTAACGGGQGPGDPQGRGPITIWLSNNEQEVAWGEERVAAWNAANPDQQVTAQQIPAGKSSEEVIGAAIAAGTTPCLIYNTSPAAVPQFVKQGGLVPLDTMPGGDDYVTQRTGEAAAQYRSPDGHFYQLPWKSNPVMIIYNKELFAKAGLDPDAPQLLTYDDVLAASEAIVGSGAAQAAIWPSPASQFFQSWFDLYPLYAAASGGQQLVEDGEALVDSPAALEAAGFWRQMYAQGLSPQEAYTGDSFADGKAAMAIVGPWAVSVYGDDVDWGVVPVPTPDGLPAEEVHTFSDAKNVSLPVACQNQATAWDFLQASTSADADRALLTETGQMPLRADVAQTYADWFASADGAPYAPFAQQAARTVEVPNVQNSVEIWQDVRNAWTGSVIFGTEPVESALADADAEVQHLLEVP